VGSGGSRRFFALAGGIYCHSVAVALLLIISHPKIPGDAHRGAGLGRDGPSVGRWQRELAECLQQVNTVLAKTQHEWVSVKGAAALTGLSTKRIRRAIKRGELVVYNAGSGSRATDRIGRIDIETWMASMRLKQGPAKSARRALVDEFFPGLRKRSAAA
jgi:hypothetical protein